MGTGGGTTGGQNGGLLGSTRISYSQEISDPTLPPNPRKAVLYRPSITHFLAVSNLKMVSIYCKSLLFLRVNNHVFLMAGSGHRV